MKKQPDVDTHRYVLDDPTLDRAAFEHRMLGDVRLALAVAAAVADMEQLKVVLESGSQVSSAITATAMSTLETVPTVGADACWSCDASASTADASQNAAHTAESGWHWSSLAVLAATLLTAVGSSAFLLNSASRPHRNVAGQSSAAAPQSIAESWLALNREAQVVDEAVPEWSSDELEDVGWLNRDNSVSNADGLAEEGDWLIEAAREFYAEGVAS